MIEMRFTAQLWEIIKMRGCLFKPPTASREAAKGLPWPGQWLLCGASGDTSATALGLGQGRELRGRQGLGGGGSLGQFRVDAHPPSASVT